MNENLWKSRWTNDQIKSLLIEQFNGFWQKETGILREQLKTVEQASSLPHAVIVSGLRRVGKSTLLAQLAHKLGQNAFYYLNFEDDRFIGFAADDFNDIFSVLVELFGERKIFIIDEIQNIQGWEYFVRRFMESGCKFYISGSNASLLSQELGTRLTGRHYPVELFPFSFLEYLKFRKLPLSNLKNRTTIDFANLNRELANYLISGGIPEALKYPELPLLRSLFDDVIYRDIAARFHLDAITELKELAYFLVSNPAQPVSYNKIKERLQLKSVNTVTSFIDYFQMSWLFFRINQYSYSIKKQAVTPKKIFCIDNGVINSIGFHFSPNTGKLLENLVFLNLRRKNKEIYYYTTKSGFEVDFYIPEQKLIIQVAQQIKDNETRQREFRAIEEASKELDVAKVLMLCDQNEKNQSINNITIETKSIADWLLM